MANIKNPRSKRVVAEEISATALRSERLSLKLTQSELGQQAGVSRPRILEPLPRCRWRRVRRTMLLGSREPVSGRGKTKKPPRRGPGGRGRSSYAWVRSGFDGVAPFSICPLGGRDR